MADLYSIQPGPEVHRIKAMGPVMGLDVSQTHRLANRLHLPGWRVGQGQERRLATLEVFLLKVAGLANGMLPTEALRNATSAAAVYFASVERNAALRAKPALLLGYQVKGGAWVWLLGHSGLWPERPPAVAGEMLITLKVREILAKVLRGCGEDWPGMPEPPAEAELPPMPAVAAELASVLATASIDRVEQSQQDGPASRVALMARKAALDAKLAAHKAREARGGAGP